MKNIGDPHGHALYDEEVLGLTEEEPYGEEPPLPTGTVMYDAQQSARKLLQKTSEIDTDIE